MSSNEVVGLAELRRGILYLIISYVIGIVASAAIGAMAPISVLTIPLSIPLSTLSAVLPLVISELLIMVIAIAISIYAVLAKIRPGFRYLSQVDSRFKICYTGTALMIVGSIIVAIGVMALMASLPSLLEAAAYGAVVASFAMLIPGAIVAEVGQILTLIVGASRFHGKYKESLYQVAEVLYIIAIIIGFFGRAGQAAGSILDLIATILVYIALEATIKKLTTPRS